MNIRRVRLLSALTGVLTFSAISTAATILSQGFEDAPLTNGTTLGTTAIGDGGTSAGQWWTNNGSNDGSDMPTVSTEQHHTGKQSLKLTNSNGKLQVRGGHIGVHNPAGGTVQTTFYVYWTQGSSSFQFKLGNVDIGRAKSPGVAIGAKGGIWVWKTPNSKSATRLKVGVTTTGWYGIRLDTHFATGKYDFYLDRGDGKGFVMIAGHLTAPALSTQVGSAVTFMPNGDAGSAIYIDDVSITTVAGATTSALSTTGGSTQSTQPSPLPPITLGPAVVVAQAPADQPQPRWGQWQFPTIERLADGRLHVTWHMAIDSVRTYAAPRAHAVSEDDGRTWHRISNAQAATLRGGVLLPNGDRLRLAQEASVVARQVKDLPSPVAGADSFFGQKFPKDAFYKRDDFTGSMHQAYPQMRLVAGASFWMCEYPAVDAPGQLIWRHLGTLIRPFFKGMGTLRQAPDGSIWTSCYWPRLRDGKVTRYEPIFVHSTDNGHTWHFVSSIPYQPDKKADPQWWNERMGFSEPDMAFMPDGSMIVLLRSDGPSYISRSTDNGQHWSNPAIFDSMGVKPALAALKSGITVASYGRPGVRVRVSKDPAGLQWGKPVNVPLTNGKSCGYTQLVALDANRALLVYSDFDYPDANGKPCKAICVRQITVH